MTPRQLEILQHALGVDEYGRIPKGHKSYYRNHFCAGAGDEEDCRSLVALGYMQPFKRAYLPYYNCFVTPDGIEAMKDSSPEPPQLSRSQERYLRFLDWSDATGGTFRMFLTSKGGAA